MARNKLHTTPEYSRKYYIEHRDKLLAYQKEYREKNPELLKEKSHKYIVNNKEKLKEKRHENYLKNKDKISTRNMEYVDNNRELVNARRNRYMNKRYQEDPQFNLSIKIRRRIWVALNKRKLNKSDTEQQRQAFHYTNTMPLWKKDHLSKYHWRR
jgi:hypothetical protein